jgi:hypothetical protein
MAVNSKDIEILWKQYSEDAVNKGISVAQFFESNGIPYHCFEKWYKKKYSKTGIVDCVVSGSPDGTVEVPEGEGLNPSDREKRKDVYVSYVNIGLSNGIKIDHHRLSYGELVCFINKLQALCSL